MLRRCAAPRRCVMGRRRAARLAKQQGTAFSLISELPPELLMLVAAFVDVASLPALRLSCTDGRAAVEVVVRDMRKEKQYYLFLRAQLVHVTRFHFIQCHFIADAQLRAAADDFLDGIFGLLGKLETLCKELGFDPYFKTLIVGVALWLEAFIEERVFESNEQAYLQSLDRDRDEGKSWTKATLMGLQTNAIFRHASASVGYNEEWELFIFEKLPAIVEPSMHKKLLFGNVWGAERAALKYMAYLQHAKNHAGLQAFSKVTNESSGALAPRFELQEDWFGKGRRPRGYDPALPLQIVPFRG